ncbi:uncharacterized protein LOC141638857 [Silene latifolia]|uniref:uncharacterized protein LOC141638857 n=1 Tax=Silene latifolia TaxID=37657 RepID=UPI003D77AA52
MFNFIMKTSMSKYMQVTGTPHHLVLYSFSALNYPLKFVNNKHINKHNIKSLPSLSSSLMLSARLDSASCCALRQNNGVGIIGGVSVLSTLIFLEKLVLWSSRNGNNNGVPFIVCSDPTLRQEAYTSSCYSNTGLDGFLVSENLRSKRVFLEQGGARCIVMPCHVSHALYGEITLGCGLPFLHVAQCVAMELKEVGFRPLEAGCGVKVGLIASEATLMAGFYQQELHNQGFEVAMPDKATMERIIKPAMKCLKKKDIEGARNLLRVAIQGLLVRAANTVILASDELQCLLPYDDPLVKYCVDPMDALARSAVKWANTAN